MAGAISKPEPQRMPRRMIEQHSGVMLCGGQITHRQRDQVPYIIVITVEAAVVARDGPRPNPAFRLTSPRGPSTRLNRP